MECKALSSSSDTGSDNDPLDGRVAAAAAYLLENGDGSPMSHVMRTPSPSPSPQPQLGWESPGWESAGTQCNSGSPGRSSVEPEEGGVQPAGRARGGGDQ